MGLAKAIYHGKERRRPYYRKAKALDHTCRNHGSCSRCRDDRLYAVRRAEDAASHQIREFSEGE